MGAVVAMACAGAWAAGGCGRSPIDLGTSSRAGAGVAGAEGADATAPDLDAGADAMSCGLRALCEGDGCDAGDFCTATPVAHVPCSALLVADGTDVYGVADRNIWRVAKTTGAFTMLSPSTAVPDYLALGGDHLALIAGGAVFVEATSGGTPVLVASGDTATGAAIDGDWVYWVGSDQKDLLFPGLVRRAHLDGSGPQTLWHEVQSSIHGVGLRSGQLYWSDWSRGGVMRMGTDGTAPTLLTKGDTPSLLLFEGNEAYVVDNSGVDPDVVQFDLASGVSSAVAQILLLVSGNLDEPPIVIHRGQVYWLDDGSLGFGTLARSPFVPVDGSVPPLAVYDLLGNRHLGGLATDGSALYTTDCDAGTLVRIAL